MQSRFWSISLGSILITEKENNHNHVQCPGGLRCVRIKSKSIYKVRLQWRQRMAKKEDRKRGRQNTKFMLDFRMKPITIKSKILITLNESA